MFQRFWMTVLMALAAAQALAAPVVSLTAPAANSSYISPATITLAADAASSDGTIVQVAFYDGQALIGSTTSAPYTLDWPQVGAGTYSLTAVATDSFNASTTSTPVTITVTAAGPAPQVYYIHSDHLNTPRLITDQNNNAVWQWDSDPFGTTVANEKPGGTGTPFTFNPRFPGQYFDRETGLHYNYFRDYDPATGRYIQSDPIGLEGGINTFAYVEGNPIGFIDPLGLEQGTLYQRGYPHGSRGLRGTHWYDVETPICSSSATCTVSAVNKAVRKFPAPSLCVLSGFCDPKAVKTGDITYAFPVGTVKHNVCDSLVINQTLPTHLLHDGMVMRFATERDGTVYVRSLGFGETGYMPSLNHSLAPAMWGTVDSRIKGQFK